MTVNQFATSFVERFSTAFTRVDLRHTWGTRNVASSPSSLELDIGRSQYIIDGKIKLKSGTEIKEFTEGGLTFEDGTQLQADVVLFCTGSPPFA